MGEEGEGEVGIGEGTRIWRGGLRGGRGERDDAMAWLDGTPYAKSVVVLIERVREAGDEMRIR